MKYLNYSAEDFALDREFQKWVLEADEESGRFWSQWMERYPQQRPQIEKAIELVRIANLSPDREANAAYLEVWEHLRENAVQNGLKRSGRRMRYAGLAASLAAVFVVALYFLLFSNTGADTEFVSGYGQTRTVVLKDGTRVTLNSNSHLAYAGNWETGSAREVYLEGEAFFNVVKTPDAKKFIVKTAAQVDVQVLGTEFNVNTRRQKVEVYLQSGKVNISAASETVLIAPGQRAAYDKAAGTITVNNESNKATEARLAWKSDLFVYDDVALPLIAYDIEDYYGWKVVLTAPELRDKRFTAKVPRDNAEVLFKVLSETLNVHIERHDNEVTISPLE